MKSVSTFQETQMQLRHSLSWNSRISQMERAHLSYQTFGSVCIRLDLANPRCKLILVFKLFKTKSCAKKINFPRSRIYCKLKSAELGQHRSIRIWSSREKKFSGKATTIISFHTYIPFSFCRVCRQLVDLHVKAKRSCQLHEKVSKDCKQLLKPWLVDPGSVPKERISK